MNSVGYKKMLWWEKMARNRRFTWIEVEVEVLVLLLMFSKVLEMPKNQIANKYKYESCIYFPLG